MNRPQLSIVVPTFNRRKYLRAAIVSLLNEEIGDVEIIVIDDGSVDNSLSTIADLPVRALRFPQNRGVAKALNFGAEQASGELVGFFDSDDLCYPGGLQQRVKWMQANPEAPVLASPLTHVIDSNGDEDPEMTVALRTVGTPNFVDLSTIGSETQFPTSLSYYLFRQDFLRKFLPIDDSLKVCHDLEFTLRILRDVNIPVLNHPALYYRVHEANLSVDRRPDAVVPNLRARAESWLVYREFGLR